MNQSSSFSIRLSESLNSNCLIIVKLLSLSTLVNVTLLS